jgi:O-acetyl-ADP-ribose deacetylase (regulator of RNase III)
MKLFGLLLLFVIIVIICIASKKSHSSNKKINNGRNDTEIILHKGDITQLKIECIVNASNPSGLGCHIPNHCIDSAIHHAAGSELLEECKKLGGIPTGTAKLTKGYKLPAKHIIHVTGPEKTKSDNYDWDTLKRCYNEVLNLAKQNKIKEIAFCCISTGLYGYPKEESASIAHDTVREWIKNNDYQFKKIVFVVFKDDDYDIYKNILK